MVCMTWQPYSMLNLKPLNIKKGKGFPPVFNKTFPVEPCFSCSALTVSAPSLETVAGNNCAAELLTLVVLLHVCGRPLDSLEKHSKHKSLSTICLAESQGSVKSILAEVPAIPGSVLGTVRGISGSSTTLGVSTLSGNVGRGLLIKAGLLIGFSLAFLQIEQEHSAFSVGRDCNSEKICTPHYRNFLCKADQTSFY